MKSMCPSLDFTKLPGYLNEVISKAADYLAQNKCLINSDNKAMATVTDILPQCTIFQV